MTATGPRYHIGTQGWNYDGWNGVFYPPGTKSGDRLEVYSSLFDSVEIDSTFHAMPPADRFRSWYERTPVGFLFTVKLPRDITHDARLVGADHIVAEFCERAALLQEKLGPLLVQLPPDMSVRERAAVERFVCALPRELDFAIEFRDTGWFDERTMELLRETGVALAVSVGPWLTTPQAHAIAARAPGPFQYLRWMGSPRHQPLNDVLIEERARDLAAWATVIGAAAADRPVVYAYFNNDYQGHSPESARRLQALLGLESAGYPRSVQEQTDLFA